jgi:predicted secreted hydrolase
MVGNASHYYSFTRLQTKGTIRIDGVDFRIRGSSWMDHEFSTSFLEPGQLGWDWFSIQLHNGIDLMLYRMRRKDRTTDPFSSGSLVRKDGLLTHISVTEFEMMPLRNWTSSATGATYPLDWSIEIPGLGYQLTVTSAFDQQEMTTNDTTGINYWEGAIEITGSSDEGPVTGRGYMELTGYAGQGLGALFD